MHRVSVHGVDDGDGCSVSTGVVDANGTAGGVGAGFGCEEALGGCKAVRRTWQAILAIAPPDAPNSRHGA